MNTSSLTTTTPTSKRRVILYSYRLFLSFWNSFYIIHSRRTTCIQTCFGVTRGGGVMHLYFNFATKLGNRPRAGVVEPYAALLTHLLCTAMGV